MEAPKQDRATDDRDAARAETETSTQAAGLELDLEVERIETEGVMKEGFSGQEM